MARDEEKKILTECENILKLIDGVKNGKFESPETYHNLYVKIMNKP